jgi:WD40 repeat protein
MVVEKDSSILGYPGEISKGLDADHHTVCKYGDRDDPNYVTVRNFIRTQISNLLPTRKTGSRASVMSASPADIRELEKLFSVTEATDTDYISFRDRWTPGTCEWILSNSSFTRWLDDTDPEARILWLHGAAGCGKSIMASFIVNHLVESKMSCQYAFIRFGDHSKRSLSMTLRMLAFQMALSSPAFRQEISKAASSLKRGVETSTIWRRVFKNGLFQSEFPSPLYWVIDGLEESDNPRAGIKMFTDVLGTSVPLRLLIVSRRTPDIDAEFKKLPEEAKWDKMAIDGYLDDHQKFVESELEWSEMPAFKATIARRLLEQSQGSFLWLRLTVERINKCRTTESVEQAMRELPAGMEKLYDRMGQSISEQEPADVSLTCQILSWVTCAVRTLSVSELTEALESKYQARSIADTCAGFVSVDNYENVTLIHRTAKEYLLSSNGQPYAVEKSASHEQICLRCLQCLMKKGLRRDITKDMEPCLLEYAATYWSTHLAATADISNNLLGSLVQFLRGPYVLTWVHALSKAKQLHVLVQTSSNLASLAKRLTRSDANKMPLDRRTEERELVEAWATDLGKLVGRFGSQLIHMPESIYKTIPPFCPPESPVFKQFGLKQGNTLRVGHFSETAWGDCLGRLSLKRDEKATALVTEGQWIAISADLENMASTVVIYHASTFQPARRLDFGERIRKIQINSLGTLIVTCGLRTVKVWNVATGSCVTTAASPRSRPRPMTVAFSKNDASVLIGTDDRRIWSMSLASHESKVVEVTRFMQKSSGGRSVNSPTSMAISPDGQQVCLGYRSSPLAVWEIDLAEEVARQHDLEDVAEVLWHPLSGELFGRQAGGFIFKWHPDMGDYERQRAEFSIMAISSDGSLLAVGSHKGSFKLLSTSDMTIIHQGVSEHPVSGLAFSWDNQQLYDIRGKYGTVWQPDSLLRFSEPSAQLSDGGSVSGTSARTASAEETRYEFLDPISALAPQDYGTLFCSGSEGGALAIHDAKCLKRRKLELTSFGIEQIAWSSDGRNICFGDLSRTIFLVSLNGDKQAIDKMDIELRFKLSLSISDNINQIIFNNDAAMVLISSRTRAVVVSLEGQNVISEICLESNNGMWMLHPSQAESAIFFSPWLMTIYQWPTLSKTMSIPLALPKKANWIHSPGAHVTVSHDSGDNDNEHLHQHEASGPADKDSPPRVNIERLIRAQSQRHLLVEASTLVDGQLFNVMYLLDIHNLSETKDEASTSQGPAQCPVTFLELPSSLTSRMDRPLIFLGQTSAIEDNLLFLDCHHSICTWTVPPDISQMAETTHPATTQPATPDSSSDTDHRRDSQASTLKAHSNRGNDIADKSITGHYSLPGDWISPDCVALIHAFDNGALLCPRNGEVAVVHYAGFNT